MTFTEEIKKEFETLEADTVSKSFGGESTGGRAPDFKFDTIIEKLTTPQGEFFLNFPPISLLKKSTTDAEFKYITNAIGRFSFCIELTNLNITSTKMKTRWVSGRIMKTRPDSFSNYEGDFKPGSDQRASSFEECFAIFKKCISLINDSKKHKEIMRLLSGQKNRGFPHETVFTYINQDASQVHTEDNIRLTLTDDIEWLVKARPIIYHCISKNSENEKTKCSEKIKTKAYKTDRSQTGEVQTNRAKRWECLSNDFQHASIEECWSVERTLLSSITGFNGFPTNTIKTLISLNIEIPSSKSLCPITFEPMLFNDLLNGSDHGKSSFQVGHLKPLKAGGRHAGYNVSWISENGNRIQGSLNIEDTRKMLIEIFKKMHAHGILNIQEELYGDATNIVSSIENSSMAQQ